MKNNKRAERRSVKEIKETVGYKKKNRIKGEVKKPKHKKIDY
jgi:hypothetical protein